MSYKTSKFQSLDPHPCLLEENTVYNVVWYVLIWRVMVVRENVSESGNDDSQNGISTSGPLMYIWNIFPHPSLLHGQPNLSMN